MINKILKELDHMIKFQEKEIELDMQAEELEGKIHFETAKILAYDEVARMIKKCAQEAATSEGTDVNTQEKYNTDRQKSEIRKLAVEILNLSLQLQENADGRIVWRGKNKPCVNFRYYGATSGLTIKYWKNGFDVEQLPDYSAILFLDDWNCINEARQLKETLIELLEERRGNDNGKDDSDHN